MNANELADYLESDFQIQEAVIDMLRQQQAEIEALKDEVAMWKMSYENNIRMEDGYGLN